jgi:cell division protease FtsH
VDEAYRRCEEILKTRSRELELTAQYLLEHETMNTEEFENIFKQVETEKAE